MAGDFNELANQAIPTMSGEIGLKRAPLLTRLKIQRDRLQVQLEETENTIKLLEENPVVVQIIDQIAKVGIIY